MSFSTRKWFKYLSEDKKPQEEKLINEAEQAEVDELIEYIEAYDPEESPFDDIFKDKWRMAVPFGDTPASEIFETLEDEGYEISWEPKQITVKYTTPNGEKKTREEERFSFFASRTSEIEKYEEKKYDLRLPLEKWENEWAEKNPGEWYGDITKGHPDFEEYSALLIPYQKHKKRGYRKAKLGKVINRVFKDKPEVIKFWTNNAAKYSENPEPFKLAKKKGRYMVVFTRHPVDVYRMSDHDHISSCHSIGRGSFGHCSLQEAHDFGILAYMVRKDELEGVDLQADEIFADSERSLQGVTAYGRIRLRRFFNDEEEYDLAISEEKEYGTKFPGFKDFVREWSRETQKDRIYDEDEGDFKKLNMDNFIRMGGSYSDAVHDGRGESELFNKFLATDEYSGRTRFVNDERDIEDPANAMAYRQQEWEEQAEHYAHMARADLDHYSVSYDIDIDYEYDDDHLTLRHEASVEIIIPQKDLSKNLTQYTEDPDVYRKLVQELDYEISQHTGDLTPDDISWGTYTEGNTGVDVLAITVTFDTHRNHAETPDGFHDLVSAAISVDETYDELLEGVYGVLIQLGYIKSASTELVTLIDDIRDGKFEEHFKNFEGKMQGRNLLITLKGTAMRRAMPLNPPATGNEIFINQVFQTSFGETDVNIKFLDAPGRGDRGILPAVRSDKFTEQVLKRFSRFEKEAREAVLSQLDLFTPRQMGLDLDGAKDEVKRLDIPAFTDPMVTLFLDSNRRHNLQDDYERQDTYTIEFTFPLTSDNVVETEAALHYIKAIDQNVDMLTEVVSETVEGVMNVYRASKRTGKTYTVEFWSDNTGVPDTRQFRDLQDAAHAAYNAAHSAALMQKGTSPFREIYQAMIKDTRWEDIIGLTVRRGDNIYNFYGIKNITVYERAKSMINKGYEVVPEFTEPIIVSKLRSEGHMPPEVEVKEQTEPYQRKVRAKHKKMKIRLIGKGSGKHVAGSYTKKPSYERSKSAPPAG